ncbi:glycosyltransferase family 8 protein [Undibacterium arcticum]|uniref:Glycosyltransferase family 8 protein n=1 Tax=Undibacterium arcticum TaxID=1762892 RepID=A0ABV7F5U3_9BURK
MHSADTMASAAPFHIAFGVDAHYFRGMGVTITSILEHNPDIDFVFHVFSSEVTHDSRRRIHQLELQYRTKILIHIIDPSVFDEFSDFPRLVHYSPAIFTRLLIPAELNKLGNIDKLLYLDSDILCVGSLSELMTMDISDAIVALVHDNSVETSRTQCATLELRHDKYFNSGVLYINIQNWIANKVTALTITQMLTSDKTFTFPDQDALNIVLDGRVKFIDGKWNYQYNLVNVLKENQASMAIPPDAVFVHFTGRLKPWHDWNPHYSKQLFLKYQSLSPWSDLPLDQPKNYKEMHMHAQFLIRRGQLADGMRWYARYILNKYSGLCQPS